MQDRPIIVSQVEYQLLKRRVRFWWGGWVAATVLVGMVGYMVGIIVEARRASRDFERLTTKVSMIREEQSIVNETFVRAWEGQQNTSRLMISWGEYIKSHDEIVSENRAGTPMRERMARKQ